MTAIRYRIGIDKSKIRNWSAEWWTDYENEQEAILSLAKQIELDLDKWRIVEAKHGSGLKPDERLVSPNKREQIIRAALASLVSAATT
jgi:hypothetical protein